jgi:Periplasmic component of the Tol biopolymer transport system
MHAGCSRRAFLGGVPGLLKAASFASDAKRFRDPATEFDVVRLTDPAHSSFLPPAHLRAVSQRNTILLFCSDRTGSTQAFSIDLKSFESRQLTDAGSLDCSTLSFLPDERAICFFDGRNLQSSSIAGQRTRHIYEVEDAWERSAGFGLSVDGIHAAFAESSGPRARLRLIGMSRGTASTVLETASTITDVQPRPRRDGILYRSADSLWVTDFEGKQNRKLKTVAAARIGPALWSQDGKTVLYLSFPEDTTKLHELRECAPDTNEDKLIAKTSQFVNFAPNGDSSVFAGVSANLASPHILLLLRVTRRELTMCEHRSTSAGRVSILFSPNSQRIFFQTDKQGKPAIYSMAVERFVEKT